MDISLTTPALLFPAISLLLLAFTNRFVVLANLIRSLHEKYKTQPEPMIMGQIRNLRLRVSLIKQMQAAGISSMLLCVICMFVLFGGYVSAGKIIFAISLVLLMISLTLSLIEIWISVKALNLQLGDLEETEEGKLR
jgi:ABC-type bacteriocin/lantibiotic exporter with double-glycine peptidase domain